MFKKNNIYLFSESWCGYREANDSEGSLNPRGFLFFITLTLLNAVTFSMVPKCPTEKLWSASTELSLADVMSILDCGCME
jgi:hypothetical protein